MGFAQRLIDPAQAREMLSIIEGVIAQADESMRPVAAAIRLEIALAKAELASSESAERSDPLFRLRGRRWGLVDGEIATLFPLRDPNLRIITFDAAEVAAQKPKRRSAVARKRNIAAFAQADGARRDSFLVREPTIRILSLSDGTRTAQEIAARIGADDLALDEPEALRIIEELFVAGLLWLREAPNQPAAAEQAVPTVSL
jgi:hypothetical protein